MEPFVTHRGRVALLDWTDVNTDLIIPARYLKKIERTGFGPLLFADKRYAPGGAPEALNPDQHGPEVPEFPLNDPAVSGATVLVVGHNFGCGSSREHAVWAVMQAGYRAVIAPAARWASPTSSNRTRFRTDCWPSSLTTPTGRPSPTRHASVLARAEVTIDLREQTVKLHSPSEGCSEPVDRRFAFEIPEAHRHRLLHGLDSIGETLLHDDAITRHEQHLPPWVTTANLDLDRRDM